MKFGRISRRSLLASVVGASVLMIAMMAGAAEFSADSISKVHMKDPVTKKATDTTMSGKFYIKGNKYRQEMSGQGRPQIVSVMSDGYRWTWSTAGDRSYSESTVAKTPDKLPTPPGKVTGTEKIQGYTCQIIHREMTQSIPIGDKKVNATILTSTWWSKDLSIGLKKVVEVPKISYKNVSEMKNIRVKSLPNSLFLPPKGYKKMSMPTGRPGGPGMGGR